MHRGGSLLGWLLRQLRKDLHFCSVVELGRLPVRHDAMWAGGGRQLYVEVTHLGVIGEVHWGPGEPGLRLGKFENQC